MITNKTIYVYIDCDTPQLLGRLYSNFEKGRELFSFEFSDEFFSGRYANIFIDSDLQPYKGRQYLANGKAIFGMLSDAAPDRWGRTLMQRRENINANREERKPKKLTESDYLLGVYDPARMGALRFKESIDGKFLSNEKELATPPFEYLRSLEEASRELEKDENLLNDKWLKQLIAPGSSLGGARPKATVKDVDGSLWVAKFPSRHDLYDMGAWEKIAQDLAVVCGLDVVETRLMEFSSLGSTFLSKRFDRSEGKRIHFISAMTALGKTDGTNANDGISYLDIAAFIKGYGIAVKDDLTELFKRIVFNMAISNTDDHLRNHGFILKDDGWHLSPLYDVNPIPEGDCLALNVSDIDNSISVELAISVAKYFGLDKASATKICKDILCCVKDNWERLALRNGVRKASVEYMRPAFAECYKGV